jgi:hypothetical protein
MDRLTVMETRITIVGVLYTLLCCAVTLAVSA